MLYSSSPIEALQRASEVLSDYWELVTKSDVPLDWRCQHEYTESFGSTTELSTEPSTQYFTGEDLYLLESALMDHRVLRISLKKTNQKNVWFFFFKQKVMGENQQRHHTETLSETCTSSASSSLLSAEDCCSFSLSTASSHKRYTCICSAITQI